MKENINLHYDEEGDFLEIRVGKPTISYFEDVGNDLFKRIDEKTGKIKGVAIFNFKKMVSKQKNIDVPLPLKVQLVA